MYSQALMDGLGGRILVITFPDEVLDEVRDGGPACPVQRVGTTGFSAVCVVGERMKPSTK